MNIFLIILVSVVFIFTHIRLSSLKKDKKNLEIRVAVLADDIKDLQEKVGGRYEN